MHYYRVSISDRVRLFFRQIVAVVSEFAGYARTYEIVKSYVINSDF